MEEGDLDGRNSNNSEPDRQHSAVCQCIIHCLAWTCIFGCLGKIFIDLLLELFYYLLVGLVPKFVTLFAIILAPLTIPLLMVALLVARFLLFIRSGDGFDKAIQFKYFALSLIFLATMEILIEMGIFFPIAKNASSLKHILLVGLPLTKWVNITCMICGFFSLSYCLTLFMHWVQQQILYRKKEIVCSIYVREAVSEIVNCFIFGWAMSEVMKRVPTIKQHRVLGLETQRWIEVAILALVGHDCIALSTHLVVWLLEVRLRDFDHTNQPQWYKVVRELLPTQHLVYCAHGMRRGISFVLSTVLLLLIWVSYFGSHLEETAKSKRVLDFGTSTFICLLICSLLWLIKDCVLLAWEANAVYIRLSSDILENGKKLYFLGLLGRHKFDVFNLRYIRGGKEGFFRNVLNLIGSHDKHLPAKADLDDEDWGPREEAQPSDQSSTQKKKTTKLSTPKRSIVRDHLLLPKDRTPNLQDIKQVAEYLLSAKEALSYDKYAPDIIYYLKNNNPSGGDSEWVNVFEEMLKNVDLTIASSNENTSSDDAAEHNPNADRANLSEEKIPFKKVQKWVVRIAAIFLIFIHYHFFDQSLAGKHLLHALWLDEKKAHESCLSLANTMQSGKEVVDCLSTIMSVVIMGAIFIVWLLLTGLASTKVLVVIASPLLAATFIFGETCKNLFEGIIFVFVVRPFNVGDTCQIDGGEKI
ncbi:hypothetical protein Cgig2_000147 [Carnegiea gigantea]|uniref:Uncharacterized protein n=1 Tax=Carnegiea gigantea TaxID=171969 RepID=A0A9Q1KZU7_9CARY|nr:hypothetical protein Cgig2_000147 [Carnegiea gigantea]